MFNILDIRGDSDSLMLAMEEEANQNPLKFLKVNLRRYMRQPYSNY